MEILLLYKNLYFFRMKTFLFVMILASCSVYCDVASTCSDQDVGCGHSYLDLAVDLISKAKCAIPVCKLIIFHNYQKNIFHLFYI